MPGPPGPACAASAAGPRAAAQPCASPAARWAGGWASRSPRSSRCGCARCPAPSTPSSWGTRSHRSARRAGGSARWWARLLDGFLGAHAPCVAAAAGRTAGAGAPGALVLPPRWLAAHPVEGLASAARERLGGAAWSPHLLARTGAPVGHMRPDAARLRGPRVVPAAGRRPAGGAPRRHLRQRRPGPERGGGAAAGRRHVGGDRRRGPGPATRPLRVARPLPRSLAGARGHPRRRRSRRRPAAGAFRRGRRPSS